jgi:hypothetical protein
VRNEGGSNRFTDLRVISTSGICFWGIWDSGSNSVYERLQIDDAGLAGTINEGLHVEAFSDIRVRGANLRVFGEGVRVDASQGPGPSNVQLSRVSIDGASTGVTVQSEGEVNIERLSVANALIGLSVGTPGSVVTIDRSSIEASSDTINGGSSAAVFVGNTKLDGPTVPFGQTCVGVYDGNYAPLDSNCQ